MPIAALILILALLHRLITHHRMKVRRSHSIRSLISAGVRLGMEALPLNKSGERTP